MEISVYDREAGRLYTENQYKDWQLKFLYQTVTGRILLKLFIANKLFSRINAKRNSSLKSAKKILPFINEYNIDITDYADLEYKSFNDFFKREIKADKRPISPLETDLISVADSKLMYYRIDENLSIKIKNSIYTVEELLQDSRLAGDFKNGTCLVFRLTVDDYHHYCFVDDGILLSKKEINGRLHTVGPISNKKFKVYSENQREYSVLNTIHLGTVIQMEIGALLVGKINNKGLTHFKKGEEKGYFELGGSTIVLLFKENAALVSDDIIMHSSENIETRVKLGEKIGDIVCLKD